MTIKSINDEIRKVEKELIRFSKRGFNINGIEFSGDVMSTKAKLITLKEVRELIENFNNKHRNTDKAFATDEWYCSENEILDKINKEILGRIE